MRETMWAGRGMGEIAFRVGGAIAVILDDQGDCRALAGLASSGQPMGRLAVAAAWLGGRLISQSSAVTRSPVKSFASSEISQQTGGPIISGCNSFSRGQPESSPIRPVSVGPPGTTTLTV